jgi:hypothetical protein
MSNPESSGGFNKRANQLAVRRSIRRRYPLTLTERWLLFRGIRISRFIDDAECEHCPLAYEDHSVGWSYPTLVCLKDLRRQGLY